jgi:hypothetical protein
MYILDSQQIITKTNIKLTALFQVFAVSSNNTTAEKGCKYKSDNGLVNYEA